VKELKRKPNRAAKFVINHLGGMAVNPCVRFVLLSAWMLTGSIAVSEDIAAPVEVPVSLTLANPRHHDQDDMCIWVHPSAPEQSVIVTSDKAAQMLFVFDLDGKTVQALPVDGKPGNIDLRYGFPLGGESVDIVAFNDRSQQIICVYTVDTKTRQLQRVDDGSIHTGLNYGFTLYKSPKSGKYYAFTVPEEASGSNAEQYELMDNGAGRVTGRKVRTWMQPKSEGCVADDETGRLYIGEEGAGVWELGAEPADETPGQIVISVKDHGFKADVEGLTILYGPDGAGYLIASSQGNGQYKVFDRKPPHAYVATFTLPGVRQTDGIDVVNIPLGPKFPAGVFAAHNGIARPYPVVVCDLSRLNLTTWTRTSPRR
jgi:3-phytase